MWPVALESSWSYYTLHPTKLIVSMFGFIWTSPLKVLFWGKKGLSWIQSLAKKKLTIQQKENKKHTHASSFSFKQKEEKFLFYF